MALSNGPIFVRGLSRSGGTLAVTLLDAHPEIAMSYELYPRLLDSGPEGDAITTRVVEDTEAAGRFSQQIDCPKNLRVFIVRCLRGGIDALGVSALIRRHFERGLSFTDDEGRFRFVESCCRVKLESEGGARWGLKCNNEYSKYVTCWPDAQFVDVVRDPRDVAASQQVTGAFNRDVETVAKGWLSTHRKFLEFRDSHEGQAHLLVYEHLVADPEAEARKMCEFLGLPYVPEMLDYHRRDLTIYRATHISMERISKPIDSSQVGRWRTILSSEEEKQVRSVCGDLMEYFGYE